MKARIISTFDHVRRRNKYGNERVEYNGMMFDSRKERDRYIDLQLMAKAGMISDLQRQVHFQLLPPEGPYRRPLEYIADFTYMLGNELVVEDVKSEATKRDKVYRIKKRLLFQMCGYEIDEV